MSYKCTLPASHHTQLLTVFLSLCNAKDIPSSLKKPLIPHIQDYYRIKLESWNYFLCDGFRNTTEMNSSTYPKCQKSLASNTCFPVIWVLMYHNLPTHVRAAVTNKSASFRESSFIHRKRCMPFYICFHLHLMNNGPCQQNYQRLLQVSFLWVLTCILHSSYHAMNAHTWTVLLFGKCNSSTKIAHINMVSPVHILSNSIGQSAIFVVPSVHFTLQLVGLENHTAWDFRFSQCCWWQFWSGMLRYVVWWIHNTSDDHGASIINVN
jgi:hypothetical protein